MTYVDKIHQIDELQAAIQQKGVIPAELLNKINYKLRLEWNYTSNSMEGNSLTKRETRTVMVGLLDVEDKPIKDVMEIRNHDKVITTIMKIGKGELNISEARIKEIHKGIMYEEDPEKQKLIGQWKNTDNYLYNKQGERFDFVSHADVSERLHKLINWLNAEKDKIASGKQDATHPAIIAFKFHIEYLTIHPFYDGNGRTARILSNLILISYGFPPVYVKEDEKQRYYQYLTDIQSYGGDPDLFYDFMSGLLLRSMKITMDALEGKSVEEEDDFIKEIQLLKSKATTKGTPKSPRVVFNTCKIVNDDLWGQIISTLKHFSELFNETKTNHTVNQDAEQPGSFGLLDFFDKLMIFGYDAYKKDITNVTWDHTMFALNGVEVPINFIVLVDIKFGTYKYVVELKAFGDTNQTFLKLLHKFEKQYESVFSPEEIDGTNAILKKYLIEAIKHRMEA